MKETSARLLRLLALLQSRREWSGAELAGRLDVTTRTVRRDVAKLRDLGYPVHVGMGTSGGYRLGAGATLPPLLLDPDEAVAVAVSLRTAARASVGGIGETALRALVKLEQVLPSRLRHRVDALRIATVDVPGTPEVDPEVLTAVAVAGRDHERLRFDYRDHHGGTAVRDAEPHGVVSWGRRWYLVAWDVDRDDWRTFRVDRMSPRIPSGPRFTPRELPGGDAAAFVATKVADLWPFRATVLLDAPAGSAEVEACTRYGRVEPVDDHSSRLHLGADSPRSLALLLGWLEVGFRIEDPPELVDEMLRQAERFRAAAASSR